MFIEDISEFIKLCKKRICIYGKDDPYISFEALESFAVSLKADKVIYERGGHFNESSGYIEFDDLLNYL